MELKNDECSTRLGSAFPALETIDGGVQLDQMEKLTSVDGAFPLLKSITKNIQFQNLRYLTTLNGAFKSLKTVGQQLYFYGNGRRNCESDWRQCSTLQTFCDSTKAFLCPLTPRYAAPHVCSAASPSFGPCASMKPVSRARAGILRTWICIAEAAHAARPPRTSTCRGVSARR